MTHDPRELDLEQLAAEIGPDALEALTTEHQRLDRGPNPYDPRPEPPTALSDDDRDQLLAAVDLLGRTGARSWEVGFDDDWEDDPDLVVWTATCTWKGRKVWRHGDDPVIATTELLRAVIDGGTCTHCGRLAMLGKRPPANRPARRRCVQYRIGDRYHRSCDRSVTS